MYRIKNLQKTLIKRGFGAVLVTKPENVRYLCGFTGTYGQLLITKTKATLITDFRYFAVAKKQIPKEIGIFDVKKGFKKVVGCIKVIGFEDTHVTVAKLKALKKELKGVKMVSCGYLIEKMRMIKDETEIRIIKKSVKIADECFRCFLKTVRVGQSEDEMERSLFSISRDLGAEDFSFLPIIAFGENTADVHHQRENNCLKSDEKILVDFGIKYKGYCTDMTRVVYQKTVSKTEYKNCSKVKKIAKYKGLSDFDYEQKIYSTVLGANQKVIQSLKVGMRMKDVDKIARDFICTAGFGEYFGHGTGHGIGLKIHEAPNVSELSKDTVQPGMVFTLEPGIYIEGVGGVRIEDMVYVNEKGGVEVLTRTSKYPHYLIKF